MLQTARGQAGAGPHQTLPARSELDPECRERTPEPIEVLERTVGVVLHVAHAAWTAETDFNAQVYRLVGVGTRAAPPQVYRYPAVRCR